jgi:hypothetical protein
MRVRQPPSSVSDRVCSLASQNKEAFLALLDDEKHEEMRRKGLRRLSFKATQGTSGDNTCALFGAT